MLNVNEFDTNNIIDYLVLLNYIFDIAFDNETKEKYELYAFLNDILKQINIDNTSSEQILHLFTDTVKTVERPAVSESLNFKDIVNLIIPKRIIKRDIYIDNSVLKNK